MDQRQLLANEAASNSHAWDDHSTALRLIHWLYFVEVWRASERFERRRMTLFVRALAGHGALLADADFYRQRHNHGIDQDRALIALSLACPWLRTARTWLAMQAAHDLAAERAAGIPKVQPLQPVA